MSAPLVVKIAAFLMFILPGLMALVAGLRGSRWFFESGGVAFFKRHLGLKYTRVLYVVLGLLLIAGGLLILLDPLQVMEAGGTRMR